MHCGRTGFECDVCTDSDGSPRSFTSYVALLEHRVSPAHRLAAGLSLGAPARVDDPLRIRARLEHLAAVHGRRTDGQAPAERMAAHRADIAAREQSVRSDRAARQKERAEERRRAKRARLAAETPTGDADALGALGFAAFASTKR